MRRKRIHWQGLTGVMALLSWTEAGALLSIASRGCLLIAGCREKAVRGTRILAAAALVRMLIGSIGTGIVPQEYFGIVDRFIVFAAVGFNAALCVYLFHGFKKAGGIEHG